jgi:hypothetical protein
MAANFRETHLGATPIRDLGLVIRGTKLEPVLEEFQRELDRAGIRKLKPHCYLSTEWGVNFGTVGIGIPFYLARDDLLALHAERTGHLEGVGRAELLRYLRHEMGHVVNYAYKLYEQEEWVKLFGAMTQPYVEEYRPEPFSRRYVRHLPGWYAQKHPDEDWSETFAVWMTPGGRWRTLYADWPEAMAKLEYCDRIMTVLKDQDPPVTTLDLAEDVSELSCSLEQYYRQQWDAPDDQEPVLPGLDGALTAIFEEAGQPEDFSTTADRLPAEALVRRLESDLVSNVYRWTGHFPERTRPLVRHLAARAEQLRQVYPADREERVALELTTLVTALAMNHVYRGDYLP